MQEIYVRIVLAHTAPWKNPPPDAPDANQDQQNPPPPPHPNQEENPRPPRAPKVQEKPYPTHRDFKPTTRKGIAGFACGVCGNFRALTQSLTSFANQECKADKEGRTAKQKAHFQKFVEKTKKEWKEQKPGGHDLDWDGDAQGKITCKICDREWLWKNQSGNTGWKKAIHEQCTGEEKCKPKQRVKGQGCTLCRWLAQKRRDPNAVTDERPPAHDNGCVQINRKRPDKKGQTKSTKCEGCRWPRMNKQTRPQIRPACTCENKGGAKKRSASVE